MWKDRTYQAALIAAAIFWTGLFTFTRPSLNWLWPLYSPWIFLSLAMVYPILEEIVFRGLLQEQLHRYIKGHIGIFTRANILTSIIFTSLHLFYHDPVWAAVVIFPSLIFGYFKDKYQSLIPSIVLHVFYNIGYYWIFFNPV